jgi:hypothetical protein
MRGSWSPEKLAGGEKNHRRCPCAAKRHPIPCDHEFFAIENSLQARILCDHESSNSVTHTTVISSAARFVRERTNRAESRNLLSCQLNRSFLDYVPPSAQE